MKIVLDAGHGKNYNPGVVKGYYEGNTSYAACVLLKSILEQYNGVYVSLTRNDITDDPNVRTERGQMGHDADLFLSWHTNGHENESAHGTSVYYSFAIDEDEELGTEIGNAVVAGFGIDTYLRKVDTRAYSAAYPDLDYYAVIRNSVYTNGQRIPKGDEPIRSQCKHSLIVEHGFHSNQAECAVLNDAKKLAQIVNAEANAIIKYFDLKKPTQYGDLNGDGKVDNRDLLLLLSALLGLNEIPIDSIAADLSNDGKIDIIDAILLNRIIKNGR